MRLRQLLRPLLATLGLLIVNPAAHAAIAYVGTSSVYQSSSSISVALPAGAVGDLIICTAANKNAALTLPQPSGGLYTELIPASTWNFHKVWGRIATGSDAFALASLPGYTEAWCSRFSGTSQTLSSIVDVSTAVRHSAVSTIRVGAISPSTANEMLWYSARLQGPGTASPSVATPTSFTEDADSYYTKADFIMSGGHWIQTSATTSAQQDLAVTPAATASTSNTSIMLALQPSSSGGGGGGGVWALRAYGTPVGVAAGGTGTPPMPAGHTTGDWDCWMGMERNTANTLAGPAGYTLVVSHQVGGHDVSAIYCKIDGGAETSPSTTFVGIGMAQMVSFSGGASAVSGNINAIADNGSTCSTSPPSAAIGISQANVLVLSFAAVQAAYGTYDPNTVAPAGFATGSANVSVTSTTTSAQTTSFLLAYYLYPFSTALSAGHFTITNPTSVACRSHVAALVSSASAPAITSVNGAGNTFADGQAGVVILGQLFSSGTGTVNLVDGATTCPQTVTAWSTTSITITAAIGNCRYGASTLQVNNVSPATFVTQGVTITPSASKCYFQLGTLLTPFAVDINGAPNRFGDATNDIADSSQIELSNLVFNGASTCANITIQSDGSYKIPHDLTSLDWRWNNGAGWTTTASARTGQGKVHLVSVNGFRSVLTSSAGSGCSSGGGGGGPGIPPRPPATKSICVSGCDYPNTTVGIAACMAVLGNGQSCEMRDQVGGIQETWPQPIVIAGVHGVEGSVKTLRVEDGDSIVVSGTTATGVPLLNINASSFVNVQGNSSGTGGLYIGDPTVWQYPCAQDPTSATFVGPFNCYPNGMNTDIASSNDIGLMNLTLGGGIDRVATRIEKTSSYIYMNSDLVQLHGSNDNLAAVHPTPEGLLFEQDSPHFMAEDSTWAHSGLNGLKITGSYTVLRRSVVNNAWFGLTGNTQYLGNEPLGVFNNDCSDGAFNCSPYGPVLIENNEFTGGGLTPANTPSNFAVEMKGIAPIFRENYVYGNDHSYLLVMCGSIDATTTAYREGEQQVYHNTLFGGASLLLQGSGYPAAINTGICQKMVIENNLFQGNQPGPGGGQFLNAVTANMGGVPIGSYTNAWKGAVIANNIFGYDPSNPSLNMFVKLTGTGTATVALNNSTQWPANFFGNTSLNVTWANGTQQPALSRAGLVLGTGNTTGVGDAPAITTTTNAGTSVTSITLADPKAFKDDWSFASHAWGGWHTEFGDCVAVGPATNSLNTAGVVTMITAINYTTGVATVNPAVTFVIGSPVWKAVDNGDGTCGPVFRNRGASQ